MGAAPADGWPTAPTSCSVECDPTNAYITAQTKLEAVGSCQPDLNSEDGAGAIYDRCDMSALPLRCVCVCVPLPFCLHGSAFPVCLHRYDLPCVAVNDSRAWTWIGIPGGGLAPSTAWPESRSAFSFWVRHTLLPHSCVFPLSLFCKTVHFPCVSQVAENSTLLLFAGQVGRCLSPSLCRPFTAFHRPFTVL